MKIWRRYKPKELIMILGHILSVCGTIGIALKFITFFEHWVFFPLWPNICDSVFLICAILYTTWLVIRRD